MTAAVSVVNPAPGGVSNTAEFAIVAPSTTVGVIDLQANSMVWDALHARIYASISGPEAAGSIVAIDPVALTVSAPICPSCNADPLALSSDDSYLYVGFDEQGMVSRLILPSMTWDNNYSNGIWSASALSLQWHRGIQT